MTYCHSSALGCQCSVRNAPGSRSSTTPVTVLEIGKRLESTRHSRPPSKVAIGGCASRRYLCVCGGGGFSPCSGTLCFSGGILPRAKYTSSFGNESNADSGKPKFFASSGFGACPIQSVIEKVPNSEK